MFTEVLWRTMVLGARGGATSHHCHLRPVLAVHPFARSSTWLYTCDMLICAGGREVVNLGMFLSPLGRCERGGTTYAHVFFVFATVHGCQPVGAMARKGEGESALAHLLASKMEVRRPSNYLCA